MINRQVYALLIDFVVILTMTVIQFVFCLIVGGKFLEQTFTKFNFENIYMP